MIDIKYKVLIVDDEKASRENAIISLEKYQDFKIVGESDNVNDAITKIITSHPDLIFLDIKMPQKDGFKLIDELIKLKYYNYCIVFLTAYDEFAIKAIKYHVFDYLLKPIDPDELENTLNKFRIKQTQGFVAHTEDLTKLKEVLDRSDKIKLITTNGYIFLSPNQIVYVKSEDGSYCKLYDINGKSHLVCRYLQKIADEINHPALVRVHKGYIINKTYLEGYNKKTKFCNLKYPGGEVQIPVSYRMEHNLLSNN
jgi:two-component system, LytTR family, response regulator